MGTSHGLPSLHNGAQQWVVVIVVLTLIVLAMLLMID